MVPYGIPAISVLFHSLASGPYTLSSAAQPDIHGMTRKTPYVAQRGVLALHSTPATDAKKQSMSMWTILLERPLVGGAGLGPSLIMPSSRASLRAFQLPMKCRRDAEK